MFRVMFRVRFRVGFRVRYSLRAWRLSEGSKQLLSTLALLVWTVFRGLLLWLGLGVMISLLDRVLRGLLLGKGCITPLSLFKVPLFKSIFGSVTMAGAVDFETVRWARM